MLKKISISAFILVSLSLAACNTPTISTLPPGNNSTTDNTEMVTIKGVVNDPFNKPMADVKITIKDNNKVLAETVTDANGEYSVKVPKVFGDSYLVDAKKNVSDGDLTQTILVNAGEKADFTGNNKLVKTQIASNPTPIQ